MTTAHVVDQLIVPGWYADILARRKRETARLAEETRLAKDAGYQLEKERAKKDTKPAYYMNKEDRHRPIMVFGGGGMWHEDMKDKARRMRENYNPLADPDRPRHNPREDVHTALDRRMRRMTGVRVFHIANNPLAKEAV